MKRLTLSALLVLGAGSLFALPTFNPMRPALLKESFVLDCSDRKIDCCQPVPSFELCSMNEWCGKGCADMFAINLGYYGDFVFNRKMKINDSTSSYNKAGLHNVQLSTNAALLEVGVWDRFQVFGVFGGSNLTVNTTGNGWNNQPNEAATYTTNTTFAWGVGGNAILYSIGCVAIGVSGEYFKTKPQLEKIVNLGEPESGVIPGVIKENELRYSEWQIALGSSYWIHISATGDNALVPYFNVLYANSTLKAKYEEPVTGTYEDVFSLGRARSGIGFGYALGASLVASNRVALSVEGRWNSESALFTSATLRF